MLKRPAGRRRQLPFAAAGAAGAAKWGNAKSKVPATYALRLDLPSRLNVTVKHVGIFPTIKPYADKTPQVRFDKSILAIYG